jgi:hypothetical protein
MNKFIALGLGLLFLSTSAFAGAPLGVSGQADTSNQYPPVVQVPNSSATNVGGGKTLLETGNQNLLANPSFEHATFNTGWTCTGITPALETGVVAPGSKKAMKLTPSAATFECYQDSTIGASQAASVQFLAMVRAKAALTAGTLKVCARQAGVTSASLCNSNIDDTFNFRKMPFTGSATSNGISIAGTSATGTIYLDDAFVGAVDLKQDINVVTPWQSYTPTVQGFTASNVEMQWRQVGENVEIRGKFTAASPTASEARVGLPNNYTSASTSKIPSIQLASYIAVNEGANPRVALIEPGVTYLTFGIQSTTTSALTKIVGTSLVTSAPISIYASVPIANLQGAGSTYSSTNADTGWMPCTIGATQGFTISSQSSMCKRQGSDLLVSSNLALATVSATEMRITLPTWSGSQLVSANSSIVPALRKVGDAAYSGSGGYAYSVLIEPSLSYFYMGIASSAATPTSGYTKATGSTIGSATTTLSFDARIPIDGWDNSNVIIGQFNGLESCADSYECTDTFSAYIDAAGNVSKENIDWINGNASLSTSTYTLTLKTGLNGSGNSLTQPLNCVSEAEGSSAVVVKESAAPTTTTLTFQTYTPNTVSASANAFKIICQKQGSDYVGKRAKAVSSDQNIATPGVTKAVDCSFRVSATGTVSNTLGTCVPASCSVASAVYTCAHTGKFASLPNCTITAVKNGTIVGAVYDDSASTLNQLVYATLGSSGTANAGPVIVNCHGQAP